MSEALATDLTSFDDAPRPGAASDGNAPVRFSKVLGEAGIHVPSTLYNEALALAQEGHLGQAQTRLNMLLALDPDDGEGHLLLAKIHLAQGRWPEALSRLDASVSAGVVSPAGLRERVEAKLLHERTSEEETRTRVAAREQGELRALRHETRTLRGEAIRLETEVGEGVERVRAWKGLAIASGIFGSVIIGFLLLSPPQATPMPQAPPVVVAPAAVASEEVAPIVNDTPTPPIVFEEPAVVARVHRVGKGDTLGKLAGQYYGKSSSWPKILAANPALGVDGTKLSLGMDLRIPE